jgi:tRNA(Ile)-lysidine synthase
MLRGRRAAERESRFVRELCADLDVPLHMGQGDVKSLMAKARLSLEEAARQLRYDFLATCAEEHACNAVATGHTRDDQAETVLLRIMRGTGTRGLAAMAPDARLPVAGQRNARLIRPLLTLTRADTERWCRELGVEPVTDPSNRSAKHMRNRVRHELLPLLRGYNPRIDEALARVAWNAASDISAIDAMVSDAMKDVVVQDGALRLPRRALLELPEGLRAHVVFAAIEQLLGTMRSVSERHVVAVLQAATKTGTTLDLISALHVEVQRNVIVLRTDATHEVAPLRRKALRVPGSVRFGRWSVTAELLGRPPARLGPATGQTAAVFDADVLGEHLWVRSRRDGDRYQPLGRTRPKKVQDILVDAHVPRSERDELPLVCSERGIAWVVGRPPAAWARVTEVTARTIRLAAERA